MKEKKSTTTVKFKFYQDLVDRMVDKPKWGLEIKRAKALVEIYGLEIWDFVRLPKVINSLLFFDTPQGKKCLQDAALAMKKIRGEQKRLDLDKNRDYVSVTESKKRDLRSRLLE